MCVGRYQSNVARDVLDTILSIQPKDSGGGGETRETVVYRLAEEFLGKLPRNYVDFEVNCASDVNPSPKSLSLAFREFFFII